MPTVIAVKRPCGWYINSRKIDSQGAWGEVPVVPPGVRVTDDSPNRKRRMRRLLVVAALAAAVGLPTLASELQAQSADEPFEFALFSPLQARGPDSAIQVLRLSLIYGENVSVKGLDIGLVMRNTGGESKGLQWGLVGFVEGDFVGLQNAAVNVVEGTITGMQWGLYNQAAAGEVFTVGPREHDRRRLGVPARTCEFRREYVRPPDWARQHHPEQDRVLVPTDRELVLLTDPSEGGDSEDHR